MSASTHSLDLEALGAEIRSARKARKLTQEQLAQAVGLSRQTLAALERGTVRDLGIRKILRVLEHLQLALAIRPAHHPMTLDDLMLEQEREARQGGQR